MVAEVHKVLSIGNPASPVFWFKTDGFAGPSKTRFCKCRGMQWEVQCSRESPDCPELLLAPPLQLLGFPGGPDSKESVCNAGDACLIPKLGRTWQRTPVFLPGESRRQRSLAGYSPRGCKEWDTTEQLNTSGHLLRMVNLKWS